MNFLGLKGLILIPFVIIIWYFVIGLPFTKIYKKAGYSPWMAILMIVPMVNVFMLYFLAFSNWPSLNRSQTHL
jgi:hypothetical protein